MRWLCRRNLRNWKFARRIFFISRYYSLLRALSRPRTGPARSLRGAHADPGPGPECVHKRVQSCVHFPPFLLSTIAFCWGRDCAATLTAGSKLLECQQVAMTIESAGNQNHIKSQPLSVHLLCLGRTNWGRTSKQLIMHILVFISTYLWYFSLAL